MELTISPLISPVILTILGISLGLIIYWFESNRSSQYVFLVLVLLLVGIGFRPALVHETVLPPDRPISIVYENSSRAGCLGISEHARSLSHQLKTAFPTNRSFFDLWMVAGLDPHSFATTINLNGS